jgi:hypothetical protein
MIRGRVCSYQASESILMVAYFAYITHRMDHERAHIQSNALFRHSDKQGNNQIFFHLLNTDIVHAKRQHDNVIYKKYLMLDPYDVLQISAV